MQQILNLVRSGKWTTYINLGIILLILGQLISGRSFWEDEAALALNIHHRDWAGLMRPLDHNQVAPIGFLIGEKLFVSLFGDHDWNYRLFPAILAAIAVFEASKLPLRRVQYILLVVF